MKESKLAKESVNHISPCTDRIAKKAAWDYAFLITCLCTAVILLATFALSFMAKKKVIKEQSSLNTFKTVLHMFTYICIMWATECYSSL